ncbi:hypothetical protein NDR87_23935 [Nocardia sp. CDC159]|uniref:DNA-directed RNA polymerase subunit beta n=1 Tax=Nocardia pulmonis TaxID=2951408 RepID=A0A9X2ECR7_9NOCA|nr:MULTISPECIES: hypothetical protein [Nocardia]MCM6777000.1 hypothetical protein [Nocardia pulmonis]MCM6789424.1 hypothetical protein [Nocardia sp. CDC159]
MSTASYAAVQEALERCRRYRKDNALYGVVEPALGRIMLEVGPVGVVTMPATLGHRVRERLAATGPIIGHPRSSRWTFLTGHVDDSGQDMSVIAELIHLGAAIAVPGTRIVLPSPADERTGYRVWIDGPEGVARPTFAEVVAVTLGCRTH